MIFYFSGTGNSLFAAKSMLSNGEKLINIADALKRLYNMVMQQKNVIGMRSQISIYNRE